MNEKELEVNEARRREATIFKQAFYQWLKSCTAKAFRKWRRIVYSAKMDEAEPNLNPHLKVPRGGE